ncbi:MAG: HD domain-containing protein [Candidatus Paceibacterota bacterium]|jgi:putative nucleotidyltransferase with HDIG domain
MTNLKNIIEKIPKEVSHVTSVLEKAGFEAYLVGGCVRDLIMSRKPNDWDVTTNAKPDQIMGLFKKTIYENTFGTVGVCVSSFGHTQDVPRETNKTDVSRETSPGDVIRETTSEYSIIEVTPYRIEAKYSDFRHPDEIRFSTRLEDDLKRRDFTVNALALRIDKGPASAKSTAGRHQGQDNGHVIDLFGGIKDIESKTLRAVGEPDERFQEDALRMLRAVRFACQLDFSVSYLTTESILKNSDLIKKISEERIRDEFVKIIMSKNPASGILMLQKFGLLKNIIPELEEGIRCEQLGEHIYDVWDHLLHALQHAADKNWPLEIRLSALFHDIGKPKTRRIFSPAPTEKFSRLRPWSQEDRGPIRLPEFLSRQASKKKYTFYGHEVVGARMVKKIMERLKFPKKEIDLVEKLVRNHMFFSDTELITLSAVRRIITKVGVDNIWLLMNVRECDRVGMKKKEAPYRLRKYFAMIEEALRDPISVGQLKINGEFMIKELGIKPGPRMGWILHALLEEVLDNPEKNTVEKLSELVKSFDKLSDKELKALGDKGKEKKEELEEKEVEKLHTKHGVRK